MLKILILILFFPVSAFAEWVFIDTYEHKDGYTVIIDREYGEQDVIEIHQEKLKKPYVPLPEEYIPPPPKEWKYDVKTGKWYQE